MNHDNSEPPASESEQSSLILIGFDIAWQTYPNDLCSRKGPLTTAKKAWHNKLKGLSETERPDMANRILILMREKMRFDRSRKKRGEFIPRWPYFSTWINQERYLDDDPVETEHKPGIRLCGCGQAPVAIARLCEDCYEKLNPDPWLEDRKATLRTLGIIHSGQNREQVIAACQQHMLKTGHMARTIRKLTGRDPADCGDI